MSIGNIPKLKVVYKKSEDRIEILKEMFIENFTKRQAKKITEAYSSGKKVELGKTYSGMEVIEIKRGMIDKHSPMIIVYKRGERIMQSAVYSFVKEFVND